MSRPCPSASCGCLVEVRPGKLVAFDRNRKQFMVTMAENVVTQPVPSAEAGAAPS